MRRRLLLGTAAALCGQAAVGAGDGAPGALRWHTAESGRTDPFVSWTIEIMRARFGIHVRRSDAGSADLLTVDASALSRPQEGWRQGRAIPCCAVLTPRCRDPAAARVLAGFLASPEAQAHASRLSG